MATFLKIIKRTGGHDIVEVDVETLTNLNNSGKLI